MYPARFVGEFTREAWRFEDCPNIGDVARISECPDGRPRVAIHCAYGDVDVIPIDSPSGWILVSTDPVHLEPSVRVTAYNQQCHYFVHGGHLQMLDDTTSPLK